jgi:hypothetical protein
MQPGRVVLLDHEPPLFRGRNRRITAGLGGLFEITLFPVGGEISQGHDQTRTICIGGLARRATPGTETYNSR